jgi:hypothetical protein
MSRSAIWYCSLCSASRSRPAAAPARPDGGVPARSAISASLRLAPRVETGQLVVEVGDAAAERRDLLAVELHLLLRALDLELVCMRAYRAAAVAVESASATSMRNRLMSPSTWAEARLGGGLALARVGQRGTRRLDGVRQIAEPPRKQHLLPATQLVAQALVTPGLGRLALETAALLVDFKTMS